MTVDVILVMSKPKIIPSLHYCRCPINDHPPYALSPCIYCEHNHQGDHATPFSPPRCFPGVLLTQSDSQRFGDGLYDPMCSGPSPASSKHSGLLALLLLGLTGFFVARGCAWALPQPLCQCTCFSFHLAHFSPSLHRVLPCLPWPSHLELLQGFLPTLSLSCFIFLLGNYDHATYSIFCLFFFLIVCPITGICEDSHFWESVVSTALFPAPKTVPGTL